MNPKTLIFIPTYNERGNAARICKEIESLGLDADLLLVDDNSPDGTGAEIEALMPGMPRLRFHRRSGKLGIGSAHKDGIRWAYDNQYQRLVTMDCDFTHSPKDIPKLIAAAEGYNLAVGSRFMQRESLPGWSAIRKLLTGLGHFLTRTLLGIPFDASGAFRVYNLDAIPREIFGLVRADGYAFFFESLFILARNGMRINEIAIVLPSRESGASKMTIIEIIRGLSRLLKISAQAALQPHRFKLPRQGAPPVTGS